MLIHFLPSFFGTQEGDFSIVFKSVSAEKRGVARSSLGADSIMTAPSLKQCEQPEANAGIKDTGCTSWLGRFFGWKM